MNQGRPHNDERTTLAMAVALQFLAAPVMAQGTSDKDANAHHYQGGPQTGVPHLATNGVCRAIAGHKAWPPPEARGAMTSGMTAFVVAVGGTSVICYLLMHRVPNRSARLERAGSDGSGSSGDGAGISCPGSAAATARLRTIPARPATREARTAEGSARATEWQTRPASRRFPTMRSRFAGRYQ